MWKLHCLGLKTLLVKQETDVYVYSVLVHLLLLDNRPIIPSKLPKLSQKMVQTKPARLSTSRSASKVPSSTYGILYLNCFITDFSE